MGRENSFGWRRIAANVVFAILIAGSIEPFYFRILATNREELSRTLTELPYTKEPGLRPFLLRVRATTPKGATVAIVTPYRKWFGGYEYAFSRAMYVLAGREVLALVGQRDEPRTYEVSRAEYVAAWHSECPFAGFALVWRDQNGTLSRRLD